MAYLQARVSNPRQSKRRSTPKRKTMAIRKRRTNRKSSARKTRKTSMSASSAPRRRKTVRRRKANPAPARRRRTTTKRRRTTSMAASPARRRRTTTKRRRTMAASPARRRRTATRRRNAGKVDLKALAINSGALLAGLWLGQKASTPIENSLTDMGIQGQTLGFAKLLIGVAIIAGGEYAHAKGMVKEFDVRPVAYGFAGSWIYDGFETITADMRPSSATLLPGSAYTSAMQGRRVRRLGGRRVPAGYLPAAAPVSMGAYVGRNALRQMQGISQSLC